MRGLIFTEFLNMLEERYDYELVDEIILASEVPNDGSYTSVGVYPHQELYQLIAKLSDKINVPVNDLVKSFGEMLFPKFVESHPMYISENENTFSLLSKLETYIHVEVKKLHPESDLPTFDTTHHDDKKLVMVYNSNKGLGALAEGLMCGCIAHFGEDIALTKKDLSNGKGMSVEFTLTKS